MCVYGYMGHRKYSKKVSRSRPRGRSSMRTPSAHTSRSSSRSVVSNVIRAAARSVFRTPRSATRSSRTSIETNRDMDNSHGAISRYHVKVDFGRKGVVSKHMKKDAKFKYRDNGSLKLQGLEGSQGLAEIIIAPIQNFLPFNVGPASIDTRSLYGYMATSLPAINPNQYVAGNESGVTNSATFIPLNDKFYLEKIIYKFSITNAETVPVIVDMYCLETKAQLGGSASVTSGTFGVQAVSNWNTLLKYAGLGLGAQGLTVINTASPSAGAIGYEDVSVWGNTPTECPNFHSLYKVKNVKSHSLASGANMEITFEIGYNRIIDIAKIQALDAGSTDNLRTTVPGLSGNFMFVSRGIAITDTTVTQNRVSFSSTDVGIAYTREYVCHSLVGSKKVGFQLASQAIVTGATLAQQVFVAASDVVSSVVQALG